MAGLYIHIPFCKSRCIYCAFYSTTDLDLRQRYVDALCREMETHTFPLPEGMSIDTVYLGGGTPSQLTPEQLHRLFIYINKVYSLPSKQGGGGGGPEVTIEMNPDDVTPEYVDALSQLPVNRVSLGAQTFDDQRLRFLHRRHSAAQVGRAVGLLRDAGIGNISIDLMYGFPGETLADWQRDIDAALSLDVEHLSAYCLMVEEGTVLYEQMRNGKWGMRNGNEEMRNECGVSRSLASGSMADSRWSMDEELERQMYEVLIDRLTAAGYEHYEISNFARLLPSPLREGVGGGVSPFRSRHNSSYWNDTPYIGLGAAAHSYDGKGRQWNVADIRQYVDAIQRNEIPFEREVIDADTHYNDRIATALRTSDGLNLDTLSDSYRHYCLREARRYLDDGLLRLTDDHRLVLTRRGLFVSDMVMSDLMMI